MNSDVSDTICLGIDKAQAGDLAAAVVTLQQLLYSEDNVLTLQDKGLALSNLALIHHWLGNYPKAVQYHLASLEIDQQIAKEDNNQKDLTPQQHPAYLWGDYTDKRQVGSLHSQGYGYFNLGFTYYWQNDYVNAIQCYEQSLAIAREVHDQINEVRVLAQLGEVYFYLADYATSLEKHQQAITLVDQLGSDTHPDLPTSKANSLNSAGNAYIKLGQWQEAQNCYNNTLALMGDEGNPNIIGNALACIGISLANQGNYTNAIDCFERSLAKVQSINNRYNEGRLYGLLGQTHSFQEQYDEALNYQRQSLAISQELGDAFSAAVTLNQMGLTLFHLGSLGQAAQCLTDAIEQSETIRAKLGQDDQLKVSIFERQTDPYQLLQLVLVAQKQYAAALEVAERGRARALVELLAERTAGRDSLERPNLADICQVAVQQQATLVEYSLIKTQGLAQEYLFIWVITPEGDLHFRQLLLRNALNTDTLDTELALSTLVEASRSRVRTIGPLTETINERDLGPATTTEQTTALSEARSALAQLYQCLIAPIANLLPDAATQPIIFIPQGALFLVPMAALVQPDGDYLIQHHTCAIAPSIQSLIFSYRQREALNQSPETSEALVIGNPSQAQLGFATATGYRFSPLPGAEAEAKQVAKLLQTEPLIGAAATKAAVLARIETARIIHIAAHGLLDDQKGVNSAISLTPSQDSNGLLTASEIQQLSLQAELVVLSACNTGRGRITGDGVIGLSRSFIAAGIPTVVVSLWAVPDAPTEALMVQFYKLWQEGVGKAYALRQAMIEMIVKHPHPKNWGAFIVLGTLT